MNFKLLIVEDDPEQLAIYQSAIDRFQHERNLTITAVPAPTVAEAEAQLDSTFDAAIIDLRLENDRDAGGRITRRINSTFRLPVFIVTATPENVNSDELKVCNVYVRTHNIQAVLKDIHDVCSTGITHILGGRGVIENAMRDIFWTHVVPTLDTWVAYRNRGDTEKALLRFVISHLLELLEDEDQPYFREEMYVIPPISKRLRTGSVVQHKTKHTAYVLLTPACDLVLRKKGSCKTDRIFLCQVERFTDIAQLACAHQPTTGKKRSHLERLLQNNFADYYHWLPPIKNFAGGFINFRKSLALTKAQFKRQFGTPTAQIAFPFVKDIVARYAAYYARQGQPDFEFKALAKELVRSL